MVSSNFMLSDYSLAVTLTLLFRDRDSDTEMSSVDMFRDKGEEENMLFLIYVDTSQRRG